ncbi:MAG: helix-turn-helix transcriptional regulator [Roseateles asaccharophilus]|uniref:helix-turn-helix transcriptional regulator n=1 Tax=Roseateles asaccharophilus TaxID=582607 RepID=UPI003918F2DF
MQLVHTAAPAVRRDRLVRLGEVEAMTGLRKSSIYLLMKRGQFPRSVQLTARCVAWPESAVLQFVQDRINGTTQCAEVQA